MEEVKIFENATFGKVRTVVIDGEVWFIGKDVATALGYSNVRDALAKHVDAEDKNTVAIRDGIQGNPNMTVINESGVYSLVFSSKLPTAKAFKRWVTSEVFPAVHKGSEEVTGDLVQVLNGQVVVSSRQVAEHFEKEHRHVLQSIREILAAENSAAKYFTETTFDNRGKIYPEYLMNRDGFSLLVMGFTGKRALEWKIKYIQAFNAMEAKLKEKEELTPEEEMARGLRAAEKVLARTQLELTQAKQMVSELKPKATYYDLVLQNKSTLSVTKIAKDYGKSAKWMNAKLHDYGVQFKQGDQWFLYQDYAKLGYTQSTTHVIDDEHSRMMTKWTQKGRLFIYETLKAHGILPLIETPLVMDGAGLVQLSE